MAHYPHPACKRWLIDVATWRPSDGEIAWLGALLPEEDAAACLKYRFEDDRKRALASRLLVRRCCADALGIPWRQVVVKRTRGRKPFCANAGVGRSNAPNFNFNVSHEGDYVALASDPLAIVGVDVAAPQQLRRGGGGARPLMAALRPLRDQLTSAEWARIEHAAPDEESMEAAFQQAWGCKEAFVKARGDGLGFHPLSRIHTNVGAAPDADAHSGAAGVLAATLTVDGDPLSRWRVQLHRLPRRHWAAVALAPPEEVVDANGEFKATLLRPIIGDEEMAALLARPAPPFDLLQIQDLLPPDLASQHEALFG
ncbi:L-aminoadipate-semialdehydedehydrogenase-phosphopantetheinyl transferase [Monoraphidium neglectum]|uniref:holo-[acyl-carrier-protein] synthase n=1 Tax=Monoraphidium neglectum TaxID=145388 RepID=A0A0D2MA25_9CHLO|nr:L-aminoadipate-semialdehydedehydrogenase-phosphopantetheinyl transferase [Monoraphidium neglectum]KIY97811.1 L-aminoadipate-semialdehydedehydrogenase-phosphopantetheinyl transferase [Monoraphidium neglectum]|eukprot:XP_013896831.1 L-aminoadipate-semialdehydedehydrogenase-phosphopantetheinyl transferase [Monoraphidium neglectum]